MGAHVTHVVRAEEFRSEHKEPEHKEMGHFRSGRARHEREREQHFDINSNDLDEHFLAYCIDWAPPFEGIHPYLLQGLLSNGLEDATFGVLLSVVTTKMDKLADRSSARPCPTCTTWCATSPSTSRR